MRNAEERNKEIWEAHQSGKSQKDIAVEYNMTQGRISQILKPFKQAKQEENTNVDHGS